MRRVCTLADGADAAISAVLRQGNRAACNQNLHWLIRFLAGFSTSGESSTLRIALLTVPLDLTRFEWF